MPVVAAVARATAFRRIAHGCLRDVAVSAGRCQVRSGERKIREGVVEQTGVQLHDVCIAAFVFRVADRAVVALCCRGLAVKSRPFAAIGTDSFMAGGAKKWSGLLGVGIVTSATVTFEFRVTLYDAARHDQLLEIGGHRRFRAEPRGKRPKEQCRQSQSPRPTIGRGRSHSE